MEHDVHNFIHNDHDQPPMSVQRNDEKLLASLGYKQEFQRHFSPLEVFGQAFNTFGTVPSLISVLIYAVPYGGTSSLVWGWAVGSIFVFFVGLSIAELGSAAPTSGSLYYWTHSMASPRCRNLLAWIVGYSSTVGNIAAVASTDWACAVQITAAATIGTNGSFTATNAQTFGIYLAMLFCHAIIGSLGTKILARLQNVYIFLNVALCVSILVALPATTPSEYRNSASFAFGGFTNLSGWPNGYAFIMSLLAPLWSICFLDSTAHISEEATNAATAVPWALVIAIGIAGILGWAINVALAFCMGKDFETIVGSEIGQPMAQVFFQSFGQKGTLAIWAIVVVVQFTMGATVVVPASRQLFAFSRDGAAPFSTWLYQMNPRTQTPQHAVWFVCLVSALMGLLSFAGPAAIGAVFSLVVVALYIPYIITISSRFVFSNDWKPGPFYLGVFSLPVAVVAVSFMTLMVVVFLFPSTPDTTVASMNYAVVVLGGVIFLSLVYYYFPKYGGKYWFRGPLQTIEKGDDITEKGEDDIDISEGVIRK